MPVLQTTPAQDIDESVEPLSVQKPVFGAAARLRLLFSLPVLLAACTLALILVAIPRSMADPDIWWHLRNAQEMVRQHAMLRHDLYSFTAHGAPWINHEWLAELPFYVGWILAGGTGVYLVMAGLIELIFDGVFLLAWRASGGSTPTAITVTLGAAFLSTVSFGPRTLLFGWLCLVVELLLLEWSHRHPRAVLALPMLFLCWVNLHGSWVIGLVVLLVFSIFGHVRLHRGWLAQDPFTRTQSRLLVWAWAGILPALCVNPWGWRLVLYPFDLAFRQTLNVANVEEWHSLDLHSARGRLVIAALALVAGRQMWRPRRWHLTELSLFAVGLYSAFTYSRFLFLLALLAAPIAARSFPRRSRLAPKPGNPAWNAALLASVLLFAALDVRRQIATADAAMQQFPVAALPALSHLPPHSRIFNEFLWGGYLEWYRPDTPVFVDSRVDLFEYNGTFRDYLDIIHIVNTMELLDRYRIDAVFFERDTPLVYLLRRTAQWTVTYEDARVVLLERRPEPTSEREAEPSGFLTQTASRPIPPEAAPAARADKITDNVAAHAGRAR